MSDEGSGGGKGFALIKVDFGKGVEKIAETLNNFGSAIYEPVGKVRDAKADVKTAKIKLKGEMELAEMRMKAKTQLERVALSEQDNLARIQLYACNIIKGEISEEPVSKDWAHRFSNRAKEVGDEEMQKIWGEVLAREVSQPGTFSLRTLSVLSDMSREDAELFTKFCVYIWRDEEDKDFFSILPYVTRYRNAFFKNAIDMKDGDFMHLESINLIKAEVRYGFGIPIEDLSPKEFSYGDKKFRFSVPKDDEDECSIDVGLTLLTDVGNNLAEIVRPIRSKKYLDVTLEWLRAYGIIITEIEEE